MVSAVAQMLLWHNRWCRPDRGVGRFGADIGVGHGLGAGREAIRLLQRLQPELPILAAHHADGVADLRGGRIQRLLHQGVVFQLQPQPLNGWPVVLSTERTCVPSGNTWMPLASE